MYEKVMFCFCVILINIQVFLLVIPAALQLPVWDFVVFFFLNFVCQIAFKMINLYFQNVNSWLVPNSCVVKVCLYELEAWENLTFYAFWCYFCLEKENLKKNYDRTVSVSCGVVVTWT